MTISRLLLQAAAGNAGAYRIPNSLRFRSSASAYLSRTPSVAGNRTKVTFSLWLKRGTLGVAQTLADAGDSGPPIISRLGFTSGDTLEFRNYNYPSPGLDSQLTTTQVFRDPSAWYHIVLSIDTTQATASNRVKLYVNNSQITAFSTATYMAQNATVAYNMASFPFNMGRTLYAVDYFDGYLAEVNFIDGQALTPSSFGETSSTTGVWIPKQYSGSYGTNGFYLKFTDTTSTTALGYDSSGNGNNWTPNNLSLTTGATYDSMLDSPTNYDNGGNGVGNYAVLNPLNRTGSTYSTSQGNLVWSGSTSALDRIYGSIGVTSSKWYWEVTVQSLSSGIYNFIGVSRGYSSTSNYDNTALCYIGVPSDPSLNGYFQNRNTGATTAYGSGYGAGDVIGVALDMDAGALTFYKNGVSQGVAISTINSSYPGTYYPMFFPDGGGSGSTVAFNFGQRPFAYTPPTGYKALNTQNLPAPSIQNGSNFMAATLYTGNGATQTIVNANNSVSFQPDLVWTKARSAAIAGLMYDSVRGATKYIQTNSTSAQGTGADSLTAFNANGFSAGADTSTTGVNQNGTTYVGWQWKAGGTAVTNTAGSITSSVSANTTSGFSVVTYTGTGANATVGHGLGKAPDFIIVKSRGSVTNWGVYHSALGGTGYLALNLTIANSPNIAFWNNTAPTSTVFSLGSSANTNDTTTMIAYCFAAIPGYSAFGSYTGNGSADGPFVFTGMRPRWIMVKRTDAAGYDWLVWDSSRNTYNVANALLQPDSSAAEVVGTDYVVDLLSNGFKIRSSTANAMNASGGTYVYACFAENPFNNSLAR